MFNFISFHDQIQFGKSDEPNLVLFSLFAKQFFVLKIYKIKKTKSKNSETKKLIKILELIKKGKLGIVNNSNN